MIRRAYTVFLWLIAPFMWAGLWRRSRREGGSWDILAPARFGRFDAAAVQGMVWVHAVSLGETRAARTLVDALLADGCQVLLTHTTATGRAEGARLFAPAIASGQLHQAWFPYDFPGSMRRFLAHYRPRVGLLIEREVWPNLVAQARLAAVPLVLVSARLSEASAAAMLRLRRLMQPAFSGLTLVLAQTQDDAQRLSHAGARQVEVIGNLKFDIEPPGHALRTGWAWRESWQRPVVMLASTRDGEEDLFLDAVQALPPLPDMPLFLLVPRHPQRFDEVAALLQERGVSFSRRSELSDMAGAARADWLLGDSVGEMPAYYAASSLAIIGGSFEDFGGQNLVEASACGVPVIVGPHTRNFAQASDDAIAAGAALRVNDARAAIQAALHLLDDAPRRAAMQAAAQTFIAAHQGATMKAMSALRPWR
nr:3-deoxy-D-manno-octulosonic acid transferase [Pseudomonas sp.]